MGLLGHRLFLIFRNEYLNILLNEIVRCLNVRIFISKLSNLLIKIGQLTYKNSYIFKSTQYFSIILSSPDIPDRVLIFAISIITRSRGAVFSITSVILNPLLNIL